MMAASVGKSLLVLFLCVSGLHAARVSLTPGASPLVATCMTGPFPELCVRDVGQRLLDIQTAIAAADPKQGATVAGAPGQVDSHALVDVALQAATEAGAMAAAIFEGRLPGFNTAVPDFHKCLSNCTVTMRSAMKKVHASCAAMRTGASAMPIARALAKKAFVDVASCTTSCKDISGDVRLIVTESLTQFEKMVQIAVAFMNKIQPVPGVPSLPPPVPGEPSLPPPVSGEPSLPTPVPDVPSLPPPVPSRP